ncbi:8-oxoguanine deaminase [Glycomyces harbinensis]|uniref:Cytosine/adenosine deaminase n=1 Tax=Glycomyces harbinensis TaxID=58114 RepID=A0A1G7BNZ7_9ACTN|nr:8-oxoguanine deaminase [Glycomyces harbinensis]SDE28891.1 Cytosine/adenosine deaminase [Glycomyces harbinensis]
MNAIVIENTAIATVDAAGTEHASGHLIIEDGLITAVGPGPAPEGALPDRAQRIDGSGCLATPGLVNTHHHLYQWATRGHAADHTLFEWLTDLYPVWARLRPEHVQAANTAGLAWLALSGATTVADHHYVYPAGQAADLVDVQIAAAAQIGLRLHLARGSMDRGVSDGGLPPDHIVEDLDAALDATADAVDRHHDRSPGAMLQIAVAPCSPFSVSTELLREAAALARDKGVRLHTHLCETLDEADYCRRVHGCDPVEYMDKVGWIAPDTWLAHAVHLDADAQRRLGAAGTGVAHCPSSNARLGTGLADVPAMLAAGIPVGLGVDGAASQEAGHLGEELRQALYTARQLHGPHAMDARTALRLGTIGGATILGRDDHLGSLEAGKQADIALWDLTGLGHAGIADPVTALVLGPAAPLRLLTVAGRPVVEHGELRTADTAALARGLAAASANLREAPRA